MAITPDVSLPHERVFVRRRFNATKGGIMKYLVSICAPYGDMGDSYEEITGEGNSEQKAIEDCVIKVRDYLSKNVMVELTGGLVLPKDVAMKMPTPPPDGYALLIIQERERWGGGYHFHAIPLPIDEDQHLGEPVMWGSVQVYEYFSQSSGDTDSFFENGSLSFVNGVWK